MWYQNDGVSTSIRRLHVASMLIWCHFYITCPFGVRCQNDLPTSVRHHHIVTTLLRYRFTSCARWTFAKRLILCTLTFSAGWMNMSSIVNVSNASLRLCISSMRLTVSLATWRRILALSQSVVNSPDNDLYPFSCPANCQIPGNFHTSMPFSRSAEEKMVYKR